MGRKRGNQYMVSQTRLATKQAVSIWIGQFNVNDITNAINDLLDADGITVSRQTTYNRIVAMAKSGVIKEIKIGAKVVGYIKNSDANREKLINVSKPVNPTKITFLTEEDLSPRQVCEQLEKWMKRQIRTTEDMDDLKHDAEQMYVMQERVNDLIHKLQQERQGHTDEMEALKKEHNNAIRIAKKRYNNLRHTHKSMTSKYESIKRIIGR